MQCDLSLIPNTKRCRASKMREISAIRETKLSQRDLEKLQRDGELQET